MFGVFMGVTQGVPRPRDLWQLVQSLVTDVIGFIYLQRPPETVSNGRGCVSVTSRCYNRFIRCQGPPQLASGPFRSAQPML